MSPELSRSPTTVLLIDSYKEDRKNWVQRLSDSAPDYVVLEAETGASGLAICHSQRVDCVITELTLPDMSGFDILADLVPFVSRPNRAVIMFSQITLPSIAALALSSGAQAYLIKSCIFGDFLNRAIGNAIDAVSSAPGLQQSHTQRSVPGLVESLVSSCKNPYRSIDMTNEIGKI